MFVSTVSAQNRNYYLILRDLYKGISTVVYLLFSLQLSLQVSLQENILCRIYIDISTTAHLLLSLLTPLQSKFVLTSPLAYLWKMFLRNLYEDIPTVTRIHSKSEILLQYIREFMRTTKQAKPETPKTWISSCSSLK